MRAGGRFNLFGPIAAFGYWIGWSVVLSFVGNIVGALIVAEWFPKSGDGVDDAYFNLGFADFGLAQAIAIVVIIGVWLFNVLGVKPSLAVGYVTGALLMIPLAIFIIFPYFTGTGQLEPDVDTSSGGDFSLFSISLMWLFIMCWSAYGIEVCASFAPEYHDTKRDTALALKSVAVFSLRLPLPAARSRGRRGTSATSAPLRGSVQEIVGETLGGFAMISPHPSLLLSMNTSTADGGRALYGIARDDMTIKWLYHLNKFHVPARGMTVDMVVNIGLMLLLGTNNFVILYISNIGYVFVTCSRSPGSCSFAETGPTGRGRSRPVPCSSARLAAGPVQPVPRARRCPRPRSRRISASTSSRASRSSSAPACSSHRSALLLPAGGPGPETDHVPRPRRPTMPSEDQMRLLREEVMPDRAS